MKSSETKAVVAYIFIIGCLLIALSSSIKNFLADYYFTKAEKRYYRQIFNNKPVDLEYFDKAIQLNPANTNYHFRLAAYSKLNQLDPILEYEQSLALRPNWARGWSVYAQVLSENENLTKIALYQTQIAITLAPNDLKVLVQSTRLFFKHWEMLDNTQKWTAMKGLQKLPRYSYYRLMGDLLDIAKIILDRPFHFQTEEIENINAFIKSLVKKNYKQTINHAINNNWDYYLEPLLTEDKHKAVFKRRLQRKLKQTKTKSNG